MCKNIDLRQIILQNEKSKENIEGRKLSFEEYIAVIKTKIGVKMLTDAEIEVLLLNEIAHTYTRDERNYR